MKKRKTWVAVILSMAMLLSITGTALAAGRWVKSTLYYDNIKIVIDGEAVTPRDVTGKVVEPFIIDGTTYLPVRAVASALDMDVTWNGATKTVTLNSYNTSAPGSSGSVGSGGGYTGVGLTPAQVFEKCKSGVVHIETAFGGGTGFFIEKNVVVTNNHVISGTPYATVVTVDGQRFEVTRVLAKSAEPDLALLEVKGSGTPLTVNRSVVGIGEEICSIGAPMGIFPTLSNGIVQNNSYNENGVDFYLGNIGAISGNSGGPVFDSQGRVIGVVQGGMSDGTNSMDMIIQIHHVLEMDRSNPTELGELDTPDEESYTKSTLAKAKVGELVSFGRYEQDNKEETTNEEILWIVTEKNGSELTLMSLYCLDVVPYMSNDDPVSWADSYVRQFLNNEFYNSAFNAGEKAKIKTVSVHTPDNILHGTDGGSDVSDKVYIPSLEEVMEYYDLPAEENFYDGAWAQATAYSISKGVWLEIPGSSRCWWWLRSAGGNDQNAAEFGSAGYLSFNGTDASDTERGVRPVIHVNVNVG